MNELINTDFKNSLVLIYNIETIDRYFGVLNNFKENKEILKLNIQDLSLERTAPIRLHFLDKSLMTLGLK